MNSEAGQAKSASAVERRNAMVQKYAPLVQNIAYRLVGRFPSSVEVEDLMSVGMLGLIDAVDRYEPDRDDSFAAYAGLRIRGAIIDELRQLDWAPRSLRQRMHEAERARQSLLAELGREPTDREVASEMNINLDQLQQMRRKASHLSVVSFEDIGRRERDGRDILQVLEGKSEDPAAALEAKYMTEALAEAIEALPEKEKVVITLYYYHELTLKEIGKVLGVTESRVSQLHTKALARLNRRLRRRNVILN